MVASTAVSSRYLRPSSAEEAATLLASNPGARIVGGGTVVMSLYTGPRPEVLLDLAFAGLSGLEVSDGGLRIGATTPVAALVGLEDPRYGALREAALGMVPVPIRQTATVGGNVCLGVGSLLPPLLLLGAEVTLRSATGQRTVPLADFFLYTGELLESVFVPAPPAGTRTAFSRMRRTPVGPGLVVLAMAVGPAGERVAVGGAEWRPRVLSSGDVEAELRPFGDTRASADYRRAMAAVMARDLRARLGVP